MIKNLSIRHRVYAALTAATILSLGSAATAQETQRDGVYQIMKATESQVWRLNTQTGEIAVCNLEGENLICTTSTDAAEVPQKTYAEIEADRAAKAEADAQAREEQRQQDLALLDTILALVREFIATALGQQSGG